jgi:glutamine synthetase
MPTGNCLGNAARLEALRTVVQRRPRQFPHAKESARVLDIFGSNTFSVKAMQQTLPRKVFEKMREIIAGGCRIDQPIAAEVAHAAKAWAVERGATHFCHWFQPQTGLTAEKHDAFLSFDSEGLPIERFSGSQLLQSEPDASSFPSGGMRSTFEARGYTAWDPSSPMFLMEGPGGRTLCIPSVFISYYGHALDQKTPLLRSMEVLNQKGLQLLRLLGNDTVTRVVPTLGAEQEYFLVDRAFYVLRPDLILAGRTLLGAPSPKGQELEDHYFGSIRSRVLAFMQEAEYELYKLGVPIRTRHNEVAPGQYECAPVYVEANVAADHNQMVMEIFRRVASLHDFALLLHEKPFAGVNGSGKHCNWSIHSDEGDNLLEPGETPDENLKFLVFLAAILKGVQRRAGLLRASIAGSGNDHRLGANEAPPGIMSVFLGSQLSDILDRIETGQVRGETTEQKLINLGIGKLPEVSRDYTDRNRTSPFAFTGNKFEFRAVGSSQSISWPIAVLNTAVSEGLEEMTGAIAARREAGTDLQKAAMDAIREAIVETKTIRFEGNNYSEEWKVEAERRGLPNLRNTPEALAWLVRPESSELFRRLGIMRTEENEARYHVKLERYIKDIEIEAEMIGDLARTVVLPAATRQQMLVAESLKEYSEACKLTGTAAQSVRSQSDQLEEVSGLISDLRGRLQDLEKSAAEGATVESIVARARFFGERVVPSIAGLREVCDHIEQVVDDQFWPLPKYREMLFLSW